MCKQNNRKIARIQNILRILLRMVLFLTTTENFIVFIWYKFLQSVIYHKDIAPKASISTMPL